VNYWIHNAFITVNGKKMSKSLNNFVTIKDAIKKHGAENVRYYFATTLYNKQVDYSDHNIEDAKKELERLKNTINNLHHSLENTSQETTINLEDYKMKFIEHMDNNFNTANAIATVFELVKEANTKMNQLTKENITETLEFLEEVGKIIGVNLTPEQITIPEQIQTLVQEREKARAEKDWAKADELRNKIQEQGYTINDTQNGPMLTKN